MHAKKINGTNVLGGRRGVEKCLRILQLVDNSHGDTCDCQPVMQESVSTVPESMSTLSLPRHGMHEHDRQRVKGSTLLNHFNDNLLLRILFFVSDLFLLLLFQLLFPLLRP